jgi:hypothetical protein
MPFGLNKFNRTPLTTQASFNSRIERGLGGWQYLLSAENQDWCSRMMAVMLASMVLAMKCSDDERFAMQQHQDKLARAVFSASAGRRYSQQVTTQRKRTRFSLKDVVQE